MGQFTQTDPIGLAGGMNLYGFADGDPVNFDDPFGLCKPLCASDAAQVFGNLESMAPAINEAIAEFVPQNALSALGGQLVGRIAAGAASLRATAAAGEALSRHAAAAGRETIRRQGSRILTMNRHALTGSRHSAEAHAFAKAGLNPKRIAAAIARDIGDLSRLAPGSHSGSVEVSGRVVRYSRHTRQSGETSVNFWVDKK